MSVFRKGRQKTTKEHAIVKKNDVPKTGTTCRNPINHNTHTQGLTASFKRRVSGNSQPHHGARSPEVLCVTTEK